MPETEKILRHVEHLKSNVVQPSGYPKIPNPDKLRYGEIAVNYADGLETISLKNSSNGVTVFRPNTNVLVKNFPAQISTQSVCEVLSVKNVYNYQNFNISFLDAYDDNFNLFEIIDYIRSSFYDVCDLHVMLNIAKTNNSECQHTAFYINSEQMGGIMGNGEKEISPKSTVMGFHKYDEFFMAGDSSAMNGIQIDWDKTDKVMTVRFVYVDNAYRMDGNDIWQN